MILFIHPQPMVAEMQSSIYSAIVQSWLNFKRFEFCKEELKV